MDGDKAGNRIIGLQNPINFSEIMYTTDNHIALPLPFFQDKNLHYIIDYGATLPMIKSNPKGGESKDTYVTIFLPYSLFPFLFLILPIYFSYLHRWNPLFYIYLFHQNFLIHMPSFYFLHSLVHSLQNFLFNKHSLKAMHLFTIKYLQVGYLFPSLDLNVL